MSLPPQKLAAFSLGIAEQKHNNPKSLLLRSARKRVRKTVNAALVALALTVCSAAFGANPGGTIKMHRTSLANAPITISLRDYGAVGDGVTDDGPALQSALEALADSGGGTLFVPDGKYAIATPVAIDFANRAAAIVIQGTPSSSPYSGTGNFGQGLNLTAEFLIKTGETNDAITLASLTTLLVENLVFIGDLPAPNDARVVLRLSTISNSTIDTCEFYGLSSLVTNGAIVYQEGGKLTITDSAFLGCAGNSGTTTSIVQVYNWTGLSVTGTRFVDYGNRPDFYSKTTIMSPFSWISVGGAAPLTNASPRRDVVIRDVLFDEGAYYAMSVRPDLFSVANGGAISLVYLSQLYVNVTNLGEVGLRIQDVDSVFIEDSHFGWSHNSRGAMDLSSINNAVLNRIDCVLSASTIIASATVKELSVVDSVYEALNSQAPVTRVITTTEPDFGPAEYVNQQYFDVLGHAPDTPAYVYWSQQRARCLIDAQCTTDEELLAYLNGNPAPNFSITGQLLNSEGLPIAGATVALSGAHTVNTLTDANGEYTLSGLATSGEYTVTPSREFYSFAAPDAPDASNHSFMAPLGNQIADFIGTLANYSIQGRVNNSQVQSMSGVRVTLTGGPEGFTPQTQNTNGMGDYSFVGLPAGYNYFLTAARDFYTFAPSVQALLLASNKFNVGFVGTPFTNAISGHLSVGPDPLAEATVTLSGDASRTTVSDADGNYFFDELVAGGSYTVSATKRHYAFSSQTIPSLLDDVTLDFTGELIRYTITGVAAFGPNGLGGVTLALGGDQTETVTTGAGASYAFSVNAGGNYTLAATKLGYSCAPHDLTFNDVDQNLYQNFTCSALPVLLTEENTTRAIAFNSISMLSEPFDLFTTPFDFGPDRRTRLVLFAGLGPEGPATITAEAEDSLGHIFPLTVEYVGVLAGAPGISQINVRLDSQLASGADIGIRITVDGLTSNTVVVGIN